MTDKFCPKCGSEIHKSSVYCVNCGRRLGRKIAKPRMSRKSSLRLAVLIATAWVIGSSLLISRISIGREDSRCTGGFFDQYSNCTNYSSATFNFANPYNLVVLLLSALTLYFIYCLWVRAGKVKKWKIFTLFIFSLITISLSIFTAYQGEQKNDHALPQGSPDCRLSLDRYITTGTGGCGPDADEVLRGGFAFEDNNDSPPITLLYWAIYLAVASFIILRSPKHAEAEEIVE